MPFLACLATERMTDMIEARLYEKLDAKLVKCLVCGYECRIKPGNRGVCGVRENREGTLYALNYGLTVAAAIDPIEKKPLYHFLPRTRTYSIASVGCNLHCVWCQNWEISQSPKPDREIEGVEISPKVHVGRALAYGCPSISYTYSEPTVYLEYALETMILAKAKGLKNIWVTNGFMSQKTLELILPHLDAANVDYKGPDDGTYQKYCGGKADLVMANMMRMHGAGVHLEITSLIVPGVNDKPSQIESMVAQIATKLGKDIPWHISRFFPAWKMTDSHPTPISVLETARQIGTRYGIRQIHLGNV